MPAISVIMAVYNLGDEEILTKSIQSILQQSFQDIELIICDDGSTDITYQLLKKIATTDTRIRLIRNERNSKAGYARNKCIQEAKGTFIAIMDADDISAKDRLQRQYEYLVQNKDVAFVGCKGEFFVEEIGDDWEQYWYQEKPLPKDFLFSLPFVHASIMFRKVALEKVQGYDTSKHVIRAEDYDLLLRLYAAGYCGANIREVLYYIRRDENQYKRRKYRYRLHETYIKWRGFKALGLFPKGILYAIKPMIVGLIPINIMKKVQKYYYANKQDMI